jgi:hypothetical protein
MAQGGVVIGLLLARTLSGVVADAAGAPCICLGGPGLRPAAVAVARLPPAA